MDDSDFRNNNKKGKKLLTIQSKIKIIKFAKKNSRTEAIKKYNISSSTLSNWFKRRRTRNFKTTKKIFVYWSKKFDIKKYLTSLLILLNLTENYLIIIIKLLI